MSSILVTWFYMDTIITDDEPYSIRLIEIFSCCGFDTFNFRSWGEGVISRFLIVVDSVIGGEM